jgi:hypothetical protein|tara:strand:+ start:946 stop:1638 length:693 start_codon:yes stop_codon:yes gene_type:complete
MGILGTSNSNLAKQISNSNNSTFKTVNNLLTLQENHVEEFFQYHGPEFLAALEKLMEDVTARVVSGMLAKLEFKQDGTTISVNKDTLREYEKITQENIELDLQALLNSAINSEVVMQRKLAKQQYLESQGFAPPQPNNLTNAGAMPMAQMGAMGAVGGASMGAYSGMNQPMPQSSNYPVPPAGQDNYGRPYWIDPNTQQMTFEPPSSGLHLGQTMMNVARQGAAWAKWLA